jgi:ATP-dependent Clp protease ATP-binding subunit ClpX
LQTIADKALARDTGARALRAVMEEVMLDMMYDLPDMENDGVKYVIDADAVLGHKTLADVQQVKKKESA